MGRMEQHETRAKKRRKEEHQHVAQPIDEDDYSLSPTIDRHIIPVGLESAATTALAACVGSLPERHGQLPGAARPGQGGR